MGRARHGKLSSRWQRAQRSGFSYWSRIPQSWCPGHTCASAMTDHLGAPHTSWTHSPFRFAQRWPCFQRSLHPPLWSAMVAMDTRGYSRGRASGTRGFVKLGHRFSFSHLGDFCSQTRPWKELPRCQTARMDGRHPSSGVSWQHPRAPRDGRSQIPTHSEWPRASL